MPGSRRGQARDQSRHPGMSQGTTTPMRESGAWNRTILRNLCHPKLHRSQGAGDGVLDLVGQAGDLGPVMGHDVLGMSQVVAQ